MSMLITGVYWRSDWALSQNREVIVQLVSLQSLFIRGVKAGGYCLSPATGPLLHVHDCNEQKVTLADNCQQTRVSPQTSIIPPAAQFTSLCPFFLPLFPFCSFLFLSFLFQVFFFFITLQLQLIFSGKLGPSTSLSLAGQNKGLLSKKTGRTEGGRRERELKIREILQRRRPQANEWARC